MKRLLTVLLALAMALCLTFGMAACGEKSGSTEPNGGSSSEIGGGSDDDREKPSGGSGGNQEDSDDDGSDEDHGLVQGGTATCEHTFTAENTCSKCGGVWKYTEGLICTLDEETNTYSVTGVGTASGKIVIPYGYDGKFVTKIGDSAFSGCEDLTGIVIPDSVTSIGEEAFYDCSELTGEVTISDGVTEIGDDAFLRCDKLESIAVSDNNQNYSSQDGIVYNKAKTEFVSIPKGLKGAVTIPDSITLIGESAFSGRSELTGVTIGSGVAEIERGAFMGCDNLVNIIVSDRNQNFSSKDGILYNKTKTKVICYPSANGSVTIPDGVTEIGIGAFAYAELTSITIPSGVTSIEQSAFAWCSKLTRVTIPNTVTSFGLAVFGQCSSLTDIQFRGTVSEWDDLTRYASTWDLYTGNYTVTCTDGTITKGGTVTYF